MSRQMTAQKERVANYWENDDVMNPVVVRIPDYKPANQYQTVILPNGGGTRQVHIHELGKPHVAW